MVIKSNYFYGNEISDYGKENGYVDYSTLAKAFQAVLNNDIISNTLDIGYWEQLSGYVDNSEEIDELLGEAKELEDSIDLENEEETEATQEQLDSIYARVDELNEEQERTEEIFQYYIVDDNGAEILQECNEIVFYNETLDMYVWGVTHYGTSWSYVLTNIKIERD